MAKKLYKVNNVTVDLSCYYGNGQYSDGDVENEILEALKQGKADELLHSDNRWPVLYHLSSIRHNLLEGINLKKDATVLEIGCGCGAITGVLCKKVKSVDAVEISPRRAEIAAYRNQEYNNLTIHVGNLNDMKFGKKFDYVTLIGVLEYAGSFTKTDNPYVDFLQNCRKFLKDDGVLILAIENRLGMKYWSGAREDHTGGYFDGITGYTKTTAVRTFARKELKNLLQIAGYGEQKWFYPHPDYKMPFDIFSDEHTPETKDVYGLTNCEYDMDRLELFSELNATIGIIEAGLYQEFANSFLVLCNNYNADDILPQAEYIHYSIDRKKETGLYTKILYNSDKKVIYKCARNKESRALLKNIAENCKILSGIYGKEHVAQCRLINDDLLEMEYIEGPTFQELIFQATEEAGIYGFVKYLEFYCNNILMGDNNDNKKPLFNFNSNNRIINFDLNLDNIIYSNDKYVIIDYEWLLPSVPAKFILYRMFRHMIVNFKEEIIKYNIDEAVLWNFMGINYELKEKYISWDKDFYSIVLDTYRFRYIKKRQILG